MKTYFLLQPKNEGWIQNSRFIPLLVGESCRPGKIDLHSV
ncbi:uncharacterized protein METZ01_LOCUS464341, partial [marine metagenome]